MGTVIGLRGDHRRVHSLTPFGSVGIISGAVLACGENLTEGYKPHPRRCSIVPRVPGLDAGGSHEVDLDPSPLRARWRCRHRSVSRLVEHGGSRTCP